MGKRNLISGAVLLAVLGAAAWIVVRKMNAPKDGVYAAASPAELRAMEELGAKERRAAEARPQVPPQVTLPARRTAPAAFTAEGRSLATGGGAMTKADIGDIVQDLGKPELHDQALEKAKGLPETAIVPMWDVLADTNLAAQVREDLTAALEKVYQRTSAARRAEDALAADIWKDESTVLAYSGFSHDPKLDPYVLKALDDLVKNHSTWYRSMDEAIRRGSTDPLIRFYKLDKINNGASNLVNVYVMLKDMEASKYPTGRKILVNLRFLKRASSIDCPPAITFERKMAVADRTVAMLPAMMAEKPGRRLVDEVLFGLYVDLVELEQNNKHDGDARRRAFDRIYPMIAKTMPDNAIATRLEESFYTSWAWDARGGGFADTVSEEGWRLFGERLVKAADAAERAWRLDALNSNVAGQMIDVCKGEGRTRAEMEVWFARAMGADPHNLTACLSKMDYLFPKWQGSVDEVLEFGRWCVEHGNWRDRLPTVLLSAHEDLSKYFQEYSDYYQRPGVWDDVKLVFEKILGDKERQKADEAGFRTDRGRYLEYALDCHQWKEFLRLADEFDDDVDLTPVGGQSEFDRQKKRAAMELEKAGK